MTDTLIHTTREAWLEACIVLFRDSLFKSAGYEVPDYVRASVGWPKTRKAIGECWHSEASAAKLREIFISPALVDPLEVAATLAHEVGHACLPDKTGHRKPFAKLVDAIGLIGKPTHTMAGPPFMAWFRDASEALGPYPHSAMQRIGGKKQSTRLLKVWCQHCKDDGEKYIARMSAEAIGKGLPICPIHNDHMVM